MQYTSQQKSDARAAIQKLNQLVGHDRFSGPSSAQEAQRQFQTLRDCLAHGDKASLVLLSSLAERLTGLMSEGEPLTGDDLRAMAVEITEHLCKEAAFVEDTRTTTQKPSLQMKVGELKLALRDGQRLGELLIKMAMLTPEQVESALKVQQSSGQRLGEALLQMRLLTPDMLESALRVQRTKRGNTAGRDAWGAFKGPAA